MKNPVGTSQPLAALRLFCHELHCASASIFTTIGVGNFLSCSNLDCINSKQNHTDQTTASLFFSKSSLSPWEV